MKHNAKLTSRKSDAPDTILYYFRKEWPSLLAVTISGLIYNIGLITGPWFEGQLAGCLIAFFDGTKDFQDMAILASLYVVVTLIVQGARYFKRLYVRHFANHVNRRMKRLLYASLIHKSRLELEEEGTGTVLTKAILDADDCSEGMRKFTTEVFDTGVALLAYACMLLFYDWRLALLCMIFPPISYFAAEKMKGKVQRTGAAFKKESGALSAATLDMAQNAITYRVFGRENERKNSYEKNLCAYERTAISANLWNSILPPIYRVIAMMGLLFALYFGCRNVLGTGWSAWDVATLTTFLSCFLKLSKKASGAAKLFNSVHKASVSWNRIKPYLGDLKEERDVPMQAPALLSVEHLKFTYPDGTEILHDISFELSPGEVLGITGPVACGKSTLGKAFLAETSYDGHITYGGEELKDQEIPGIVGYLGHEPELFSDTIENNIRLGDEGDVSEVLRAVCMEDEVAQMEDGLRTRVGSGGVRLSGGQAKRLALARTLFHLRPLLILDDPFSALDRTTEEVCFSNLQRKAEKSCILLISHRLYLFPRMSKVLWMEEGRGVLGTHEELIANMPAYAALYHAQMGGEMHEA